MLNFIKIHLISINTMKFTTLSCLAIVFLFCSVKHNSNFHSFFIPMTKVTVLFYFQLNSALTVPPDQQYPLPSLDYHRLHPHQAGAFDHPPGEYSSHPHPSYPPLPSRLSDFPPYQPHKPQRYSNVEQHYSHEQWPSPHFQTPYGASNPLKPNSQNYNQQPYARPYSRYAEPVLDTIQYGLHQAANYVGKARHDYKQNKYRKYGSNSHAVGFGGNSGFHGYNRPTNGHNGYEGNYGHANHGFPPGEFDLKRPLLRTIENCENLQVHNTIQLDINSRTLFVVPRSIAISLQSTLH